MSDESAGGGAAGSIEQSWAADALVPDPDEQGAYDWDLTSHELRRLSATLEGMPDWDPDGSLRMESEAYRMLMSNLDEEQQAIHRMLVEAGVLGA
jgi:bacterioferritin (cytochrome b1)